jgi:hypothetical protein
MTPSRFRRGAGALVALAAWGNAAFLLRRLDPGPEKDIALFAAAGAALASILAAALRTALRRGSLSPLQACLLASLLAHLGAGYGMGSWMVIRVLHDPHPEPALEASLDSEAMAKESLSLRMREERVPIELAADLPAAPPPAEPSPARAAPVRVPTPDAFAIPAGRTEFRGSLGFLPVELPVETRAPVLPRETAGSIPPFPAALPSAGLRPLAFVAPLAPASAPQAARPSLPPLDFAALAPAPDETLPPAFALREPERRAAVLERLGGDAKTEAAVERALEWLRRHQEDDGRWSMGRFGGKAGHDVAATGFAVLCFAGWGARHDRPGPDQAALRRALDWLQGEMKPDGDLTGGRTAGMYDQGIGTLALAEAYGMTRDPALRPPLQRAIGLILKSQHPVRGGWRYAAVPRDSDMSVTGWQMMALRAAELSGIEVPQEAWRRAENWLDWVGGGKRGGLYGYVTAKPSPAMTAQGMIGRQLLGASADEARMKESAAYLSELPPEGRNPNFYYWYVASLALYQNQGTAWTRWNAPLKELLLSTQTARGEDAGSWAPAGAWASGCGRLGSTALATLSLEVYYRYARVANESGETR